eukprot:TRINITY_DN3665_c0_g1_i1.p1 TRINITY_DN3665_c0_g1~~TRINITY_DN3665_c0_g1_i1.p1  ORF type:complete len:404 (+),score=116.96 TRINITY_DN3665_c0_g1_i1:90-1301(+)
MRTALWGALAAAAALAATAAGQATDCAVAGPMTCGPAGQSCTDMQAAPGWECNCRRPLVGAKLGGLASCVFEDGALTAVPGAPTHGDPQEDSDDDTLLIVVLVVGGALAALCAVLACVAYAVFAGKKDPETLRDEGQASPSQDQTDLKRGLLEHESKGAQRTPPLAAQPPAAPIPPPGLLSPADAAPPPPPGQSTLQSTAWQQSQGGTWAGQQPALGQQLLQTFKAGDDPAPPLPPPPPPPPQMQPTFLGPPQEAAAAPPPTDFVSRVQRLLSTLTKLDEQTSAEEAEPEDSDPGGKKYMSQALHARAASDYEYRYKTYDRVPFLPDAETVAATQEYFAREASPPAGQPAVDAAPRFLDYQAEGSPRLPMYEMKAGRVVDVTDPQPVIVHGVGGKPHVTEVEV